MLLHFPDLPHHVHTCVLCAAETHCLFTAALVWCRVDQAKEDLSPPSGAANATAAANGHALQPIGDVSGGDGAGVPSSKEPGIHR